MVILKELVFESNYLWEGVVVLKELISNSFNFWSVLVVLIELIFHSLYFGKGHGGHQRSSF